MGVSGLWVVLGNRGVSMECRMVRWCRFEWRWSPWYPARLSVRRRLFHLVVGVGTIGYRSVNSVTRDP